MRKYIFIVLTLCFFCCEKKQNGAARYNREQITSLHLKTTKLLNVETDSAIKVDLNPFLKKQSFDFGSLVKEIKMIPLETTNKSLLDNIRKVVVTDSNIYIYDDFKDGGIVIFNKEGKFIKRIPSGKGPGELNRLYDIDFDKSKNELIAYQHSFLVFYSSSGEFIRQERVPFGAYNFTVIPDGYIFKTLDRQGNEHLGELLQDLTFLVTDKNFKLKLAGLPLTPSNINLGRSNYLFNSNNTTYTTQSYSNVVYQYTPATEKLKAKYSLDFSKKRLPENYLRGTWDAFESAIKKNNYYFNLGEYVDTGFHHAFFLENWHIGMQTIVFRDKKSGKLLGGTNANYRLNEIPRIAFPKSAFGNYFISWYYPNKNDLFSTNSSIISDEDKQKIKNLTKNDNPVIVFYKLKNF